MARLPPAEKLPLALRKNVRDEWENNKADLEAQLSDVLGAPWTIELNPLAIWPYHNDGYAKESLGSCIKAYIEGAIYTLKYQAGKGGDAFKNEVNTICHAHVLTLDVETEQPARFSYAGCDVDDAGRLRLLFTEKNLGSNIDSCCEESTLTKALNAAPSPSGVPLSYVVRMGIHNDYDTQIVAIREQIATLLDKPVEAVTLTPNFEANFAALSASSSSSLRDDWQRVLPDFTRAYFDALAYQLKYIKTGEDEMIREGVLEAVSTNEYAFRVVEKLKKETYNECEIEDGVLYLQTTPQYFGSNIDQIASKLMDLL
ncbi:hypothetical protein B0J18DRAFT_243662 [Chaetomium sp. MPI-SDFR-AT-0129]|nr:hypothetical protein B0J18DRAFT_243662 [Chaetomium sp. MPI-SDFR-AT-0129]